MPGRLSRPSSPSSPSSREPLHALGVGAGAAAGAGTAVDVPADGGSVRFAGGVWWLAGVLTANNFGWWLWQSVTEAGRELTRVVVLQAVIGAVVGMAVVAHCRLRGLPIGGAGDSFGFVRRGGRLVRRWCCVRVNDCEEWPAPRLSVVTFTCEGSRRTVVAGTFLLPV